LGRIWKEKVVSYNPGMVELRKTAGNLGQDIGVSIEIRTKHLLYLKRYRYTNLLGIRGVSKKKPNFIFKTFIDKLTT
jgi:hypothetical protein